MKLFHILTILLVFIGGINWGLVALLDVNLVTTIFGTGVMTTLVYLLVTFSTFLHVLPMVTKTLTTTD